MGCFECVLESVHFVVVTASQLGELGGERANHAARVVLGMFRGRLRRCPLLGAELFHSFADLRCAVKEVERDAGGLRESAEGDRLPGADQFVQALLGPGCRGGAVAARRSSISSPSRPSRRSM